MKFVCVIFWLPTFSSIYQRTFQQLISSRYFPRSSRGAMAGNLWTFDFGDDDAAHPDAASSAAAPPARKGKGQGKGKGTGKGKAKNPKASFAATAKRVKKGIAKPDDADGVVAPQRWQFTAARFIWQKHVLFGFILEKFGDKVTEYSIAHERGTHDHTDLYVVFEKKQDWATLDQVTIEDEDGTHRPHVVANTARGAQFRAS